MKNQFDEDAVYTIKGYSGIAWRFYECPKVWESYLAIETDEDGDEKEVQTGEGEWIEDRESGRVIMRMVGDDRNFEFDVEDLTVINEEDYCSGCGQIGCTADGKERE